jgi:hypothetical protein
MTRPTADWLRGQVTAIAKLAQAVRYTMQQHSLSAAAELKSIEYACNRAEVILKREADES